MPREGDLYYSAPNPSRESASYQPHDVAAHKPTRAANKTLATMARGTESILAWPQEEPKVAQPNSPAGKLATK
eukprot:5712020-Pyramimonas_sp.AAC.1